MPSRAISGIIVAIILVSASILAIFFYFPGFLQRPERVPDVSDLTDISQSSIETEIKKVQTPFQQSLQESLDRLEREGKPRPKVTFESNVIAPPPSEREDLIQRQGSFETTVVAKTTIEFDGPQQAGKTRWDDIIIGKDNNDDDDDNDNNDEGSDGSSPSLQGQEEILLEGNLTQMLIDEHPEIYGEGRYQYGQEPRTFVIDENVTTTFVRAKEISILSESNPHSSSSSSSAGSTSSPLPLSPSSPPSSSATPFTSPSSSSRLPPPSSSFSSNVVMGFSYVPDRIDYSINPKWKFLFVTIAEAKAGFIFDVGFGLRLPIRVDVTTPSFPSSNLVAIAEGKRGGGEEVGRGEEREEGKGRQQHDFTTSITPLNFDAQDYERLGLPAENGHEFFARMEMFLGFKAWFLGKTVVNYAIDSKVDVGEFCLEKLQINCQDFVTPFGLDENGIQREFPIPAIDMSPDDTGLEYHIGIISLGLGLRVKPELSSDKITAQWLYVGSDTPIGEREERGEEGGGEGEGMRESGEIVYDAAYPAAFSFGQGMDGEGDMERNVGATGLGNSTSGTVIVLDNYKLHLNRQIIALLANVQLEFFGYDLYQTKYWKLTEFNFSSFFGEPVIRQHAGTQGVVVSWNRALLLPVSADEDNNNDKEMEPEAIGGADSSFNATLTVSTDKNAYATGDTVIISGYSAKTGQPALIQVFNPRGAAYRFDVIPASDIGSDGKYTYLLKIGGKLGEDGTYRVIITESDQRAETTFSFN